jgi:small subunit ribosomal protein S16
MGRTHRPFYRLNAIEKRNQRDGKIIENLGWYDPCANDETKQVSLDEDRIRHWLSVGAQPSETVMDLLGKAGIMDAEKIKADRMARVAGKMKAQEEARIAAEKAAAEAAAKKAAEEAEAKKKAEAEAAAKAAAESAEAGEGEAAES